MKLDWHGGGLQVKASHRTPTLPAARSGRSSPRCPGCTGPRQCAVQRLCLDERNLKRRLWGIRSCQGFAPGFFSHEMARRGTKREILQEGRVEPNHTPTPCGHQPSPKCYGPTTTDRKLDWSRREFYLFFFAFPVGASGALAGACSALHLSHIACNSLTFVGWAAARSFDSPISAARS